jgi:hypothetical protein
MMAARSRLESTICSAADRREFGELSCATGIEGPVHTNWHTLLV